MLERVKLFAVHSTVHLVLYTLPRCLFALFVRLPVTLWELITMKRPFTYSFRREREVKVVATSTDSSARQRLLQLFGLSQPVHYSGPLYSGHIHTVLGAARIPDRVPYERELMDAEDGNPICLDWLHAPKDRAAKVKGIVLVVPGLGNYGQTPYIQRLARYCVAHDFHCCVLTPRGMGSAPLTVPRLTCATFTNDLRVTLRKRLNRKRVVNEFGRTLPLFLIGYSAGATTSLKMLAEEEERADAEYPDGFPVTACVAVSGAYDFHTYAKTMLSPVSKALYQKPMLSALQKYAKKHRAVFAKGLPGLQQHEHALDAFLATLTSVQDFEEHVVGPHFGYGNAAGYYNEGWAPQWVKRVRIPVVCVAARDDPVVGYGVQLDAWQSLCDDNSNIVYVEAPTGGHLGFQLSPVAEWRCDGSFLYSFPVDICAKCAEQRS